LSFGLQTLFTIPDGVFAPASAGRRRSSALRRRDRPRWRLQRAQRRGARRQHGGLQEEAGGSDRITNYKIFQAAIDANNTVSENSLMPTEISPFSGMGMLVPAVNSSNRATPIIRGQVLPGESDWYKVDTNSGDRVIVMVDNNPDRNARFDKPLVSRDVPRDIRDGELTESLLEVRGFRGRVDDLDVTVEISHRACRPAVDPGQPHGKPGAADEPGRRRRCRPPRDAVPRRALARCPAAPPLPPAPSLPPRTWPGSTAGGQRR
jgi:hypothetical protein